MPFDSFDLEALDRLAQGGESFDSAQDREPIERLVEPFEIWCLEFFMVFIKKLIINIVARFKKSIKGEGEIYGPGNCRPA